LNSRTLSWIAIVGFLLLGGIAMGLRYRALRAERIATEDSQWELTYSLQFVAENLTSPERAVVTLGLPIETRYCDVLNETWNIPNPNLHSRVIGPRVRDGNRLLELTTRQASPTPYTAAASFILRLSPRPNTARDPALENLTIDARTRYLREDPTIPKANAKVQEVAALAPDESGETDAQRLQWVFEYCSGIDSKPEAAGDTVEDAVQYGRGTPLARARTMVTLCRVLQFPARLVTGFVIRQGDVVPHVWVEVFQRQEWIPFDPTNGYSFSLPMNFVPVRRDAEQVFAASNNVAATVRSAYSIRRLTPDRLVMQGEMRRITQIFDLTRLPVPMHKVMMILLLLPFAALITSFVRNVIGLGTFGTFAPSLLAMSFIYADWETGVAILLVVVTAGLTGRIWLERLRLLMVPRLSIILTLVILCVVFSVSLFDFLGVTPGAQAVLLPMVILTILIERFHVTVEEDGLVYALQLAVGTVVVAMLCFMVLGWDEVGQWVLTYPEVHFFTIAVFILLGRYAGYRFTELWRFRDLVEPSEPVK
jgi:transglutaminase-like putative cysteine protease